MATANVDRPAPGTASAATGPPAPGTASGPANPLPAHDQATQTDAPHRHSPPATTCANQTNANSALPACDPPTSLRRTAATPKAPAFTLSRPQQSSLATLVHFTMDTSTIR